MKIKKLDKKRRLRTSKEGVHSLIGELLVMAVTIILFSGIFTYVLSLPPPDDTTYTDFDYTEPKITYHYPNINYCDRSINVTNTGGQDLYDHSTGIYLFVNDTLTPANELKIHDGGGSMGSTWKVGGVWNYDLKHIDPNASVRIMVLDKSTNTIVFDQFLTGLPNAVPVIGERGTTPTVGVITELASFYAYIVDSNNDLVSTKVDMTSIGDRLSGDDYIELKHVSGALYMSEGISVTPGWRGGVVTTIAKDRTGNIATANMILQAIEPEGSNETGYEPPNIIYSKTDGFNIFQKVEWQNHNFDATPQYSFVLDSEDAAVVVVSKTLFNTEARNYLEVVNVTTKAVIYSTDVAFVRYKFTSGFYCYQAYINIDSPEYKVNERYMVNVHMKDNAAPSHTILVNHEITTRNGGNYPEMMTYVNRTDPIVTQSFWNNDIVEVKISDVPANMAWYGLSGDVIIRDFTGDTQMHWAPAVPSGSPSYYWNNGPVSNVVKINDTTYGFAINLTAVKSGDPWVEGRNQAYLLDFDMFTVKDIANKYYQYQLSTIIYISSPTFSGGVAVGFVEGISPSNGGGGQYYEGNADWVQSSSMQYYINDNSWIPPVPIDQDFWNHHRPQTLLCASGDIDGDGQAREVVSFYASATPHQVQTNNVFGNSAYPDSEARINLNVYDGKTWAVTEIMATGGTEVKSLILANIDQDNDLDVIYGMKDGSVMIGRNNGDNTATWTWTHLYMGGNSGNSAKSVVALAAANLAPNAITNNISRGASIVVGCNDGSVYVLRNVGGFGNWDTNFGARVANKQDRLISLNVLPSSRVSSMDLWDMNHDGSWDLVLLRTTAALGELTVCYNSDLFSLAPSASVVPFNNIGFGGKTNITVGKFLGNDVYPDIIIMSEFKGIYFINNTRNGANQLYTWMAASIPYATFDTPANPAVVTKAALSCMIGGDMDGDGYDDLIIGTMLNSNALGYDASRISKGAVFVVINGNGTPSGFQRYLVDDAGTPIRCLAMLQ